jgi:predicted aldo/keto reductase-like oxidoreductase
MQYRTDKKSGNKLSALGYGCMRFPRTIAGVDMKKARELIMRSVEAGINYFDTAWLYPGSEETLGTIFEENKVREKVHIATKLPVLLLQAPSDFDKYFNQSIKRLKTNYVDYYLMHQITDMALWQSLKKWGIEQWLAEKKKSGQIRHAGFSFHGSCGEFLKVLDDYDWDMCLIQYNYSDENLQAGVTGLKKAAEKMPVMIMEPLLGGKLATGLPKEAVEIFKKANPNLSPAGWGLNWLWNQKEVTVLLSCMDTIPILEENLRYADAARTDMLVENDMNVYREALAIINRNFKIRCTGCNYCMPCPKEVNIPGCFEAYNTSYSMGYRTGLWHFITSTAQGSEHSGSPSQCVKCGKCEKMCPQKLPIMRYLKQVERRLEPFFLKWSSALVRFFFGKARKKITSPS